MIIIDVRTKDEFDAGHVDGAINISADQFMRPHLPDALKHVSKEEHIIVYCLSGARSSAVHSALNRLGFTHVENGINQAQIEQHLRR